MSSQALRHLSMFLAAAIIIWACQTCCRFSYILRFTGTVLCIYYSLFNCMSFSFFFCFVHDQKWGMDLLGISGSLANTHIPAIFVVPIHVLLPLLHISCFCFPVNDDSSAILCCPYRTSCTTPTDIPPNWSLFQFPTTTQPLPSWTSLP